MRDSQGVAGYFGVCVRGREKLGHPAPGEAGLGGALAVQGRGVRARLKREAGAALTGKLPVRGRTVAPLQPQIRF